MLRSREGGVEQDQRAENVTFPVDGQSRAQVFPLDLMPRLVASDEWADLTEGPRFRARALNAFLCDIYSEQAIVADGIIGVQALDRAPGFRSAGRLSRDVVRGHIHGAGPGVRPRGKLDGAGRQFAHPVRHAPMRS